MRKIPENCWMNGRLFQCLYCGNPMNLKGWCVNRDGLIVCKSCLSAGKYLKLQARFCYLCKGLVPESRFYYPEMICKDCWKQIWVEMILESVLHKFGRTIVLT